MLHISPARLCLQVQFDKPTAGFVLAILHARCVQHALAGADGRRIGIFIAVVDDLPDAGLDDGLRTFVTREECYINAGVIQSATAEIQNRVHLRMGHILIFGVVRILCLAVPRELII